MNEEQRCPNCFKGSIASGTCPVCGYGRQEEKPNPLRLPEMFLLENRYLIGRVLGCGGFGITYKSFDVLNQSCCAIKEFVPRGIVTREEHEMELHVTSNSNIEDFEHGKKRFMDEAEVLKKLTDVPEVVQITDYFTQNNTAYFVMEYLEGATLKQLMATFGGKIPLSEAEPIFYRAGMALDQVHKKAGIFHRDISPDNIMVNQNGRVKLIDFGNAKYIIGKNSQTLSVILKHGYAPPEQYSSTSSQGSYTDVYALAATFYYAVSGVMVARAPERFTGEEYRPLNEVNPEVGEEVSRAVDQALILNKKNRTQSVAELVSVFGPDQNTQDRTQVIRVWPAPPQISEAPAAVSHMAPYLRIAGGSQGVSWNIPENTMIKIGRSSERADIVPTKNITVSKEHCELFCDALEKKFYLVDRSTNGTYIGNMRLEKDRTYILGNSGQFSLGNHACDLEVGWRNG
ncbi:MAG: protein kinase [Lachnospiraceae bacterium]|nr:protein kinase [Lachnospiraceae bacterium]